jgi:AraC family transcriptional regulator
MSILQTRRQGDPSYPTTLLKSSNGLGWRDPSCPTTLLKSSNDLGWANLFAELRSFSSCEAPGSVAPHARIGIPVRGSDQGLVTCKLAGSWQSGRPTTGSIWLQPIGGKYDEIRIGSPGELEAIYIYVPTVVFARLMDDYNLPAAAERSIRYSCGVQDEVINQIGLSVLSEMMCPTAAGRMLVETSSLLLAARLAHTHSETELIRRPISSRHRLDDRRLRRVLAYIEDHLAENITVADLANVACLSIFHFTRAFSAAMGVPPHRYVSQRRLESAKVTIATGRASLHEIALDCQFSSETSFTRAFRRAIGMTPAAYRRTLR